MGRFERIASTVEVDSDQHITIGRQALIDLDDAFIEQFGQYDVASEEMRSVLITNPESVAESLGDYQHSPVALAFQQRVSRHRSAHLDRVYLFFRDPRIIGKAEELANSLYRRVLVALRVL